MVMNAAEDRIALVERRLEELEETVEILADKKLLRSIERGLEDVREGRYKKYASVDSLFKDIESSA
jgi:hypothetical protein